MRIKMQRSVFVINSNDRIRSSSILWYAHTNLTGKKKSVELRTSSTKGGGNSLQTRNILHY